MRRITISAIALAITLAPAALTAQTPDQPRGPRGHLGAPVERLIENREELGLSVQQVAELRRIQTELQEKNRPLLEQLRQARAGISPEQRQQMRETRRAAADSVRSRMQQMTPEQRQQMRERMQQMTPEQRQQMRERMQQMTPEQRQQMRERMQQMTPEKRQQMRERMPDRRPGGPALRRNAPEELRPLLEQIAANSRDAAAKIRATLTPEQQERLTQLRSQRRGPARVR